MAIQPTPPIQLDPSLDRGHELAFINQNFNNIASVIGQNSFVILKSDIISLPLNITVGGSSQVVVPHGLGIIPVLLAFTAYNNVYQPLPYVVVNSFSSGANKGLVAFQIYCYCDNTNLVFNYEGYTQGTGGSAPIKYYALQQTAN